MTTEFGQSLRKYRKRREWTQQELAEEWSNQANYEISDSEISRWETGKRGLPRRELILSLQPVLGLNDSDMDDLLSSAGYAALDYKERMDAARITAEKLAEVAEGQKRIEAAVEDFSKVEGWRFEQLLAKLDMLNPISPNVMPQGAVGIAASSVQKSILPGTYLAMFAGLLNAFNPESEVVIALYALVGCVVVLWQGLTKIRKVQIASRAGKTSVANQRCIYLAEFLFMSLFVMLNTSLLVAAYTGMDMYGFFVISEEASKFTAILYSGLVNLGVAMLATMIFYILWQWRFGGGKYEHSDITVNTFAIVLPPLLLTYTVVALFGTMGSDAYFLVVLIPFSLAFLAIAGYSHPRNQLDQFLSKVLLVACGTGILLGFLLAITGLLVVTALQSPDVPHVIESHVWTRSIDWQSLGYEPDQYVSKHEAGFTWMVLTGMAYMILIPGSALLMTVYRLQYLPSMRGREKPH